MFGRWLGARRGAIAAGLAIFMYTIFVGADAAVVRAAVMGGLSLLARQVGRQTHGMASLSAAAVVMTVANPLVLWDVGFQLSFAASLGLILYAEPLKTWFIRFARRWMPVRALHKLFSGKSSIRPILDDLGGTVVFEMNDSQHPVYSLSLIGILITECGELLEKRLLDYLYLAYQLAIEEPLRTHVHSKEAGEALNLGSYELAELGTLLMTNPFTSGGSYSQNEWNAGLPKNIEDFPDDLSDYINHTVISSYDPSSPVSCSDRLKYSQHMRQEKRISVFWFVNDDQLRISLESDWIEIQNIHDQGAWKSMVVLSGGIIEGVLLDTLRIIEDDARAAYSRIRKKPAKRPIQKWDFLDLIDVSKELGLLRGASPYLGHAIRELRNLIHPAKGLVLDKLVTQRDADLALKLAETLIQDIAENKTRSE